VEGWKVRGEGRVGADCDGKGGSRGEGFGGVGDREEGRG